MRMINRIHSEDDKRFAIDINSDTTAEPEKMVVYIPDSVGDYSEINSIVYKILFQQLTTHEFRINKFSRQFPLRLDPCQLPALIRIYSIIARDITGNSEIWKVHTCLRAHFTTSSLLRLCVSFATGH